MMTRETKEGEPVVGFLSAPVFRGFFGSLDGANLYKTRESAERAAELQAKWSPVVIPVLAFNPLEE
mgnify:FL=1